MKTSAGGRALEGLRVLEWGLGVAGPVVGRFLAHHGAEVIKIESRPQPDSCRLFGSAWTKETPGFEPETFLDTTPFLGEYWGDKRSVGLDLKSDDGMEAALRLVAASDVFVTNYSAPAVRSAGLSPERLAEVHPGLIYVAIPGFGSDPATPYYDYVAWGPNQSPLVGLDDLTGYPDQDPAGITAVALPDYFCAQHALVAVLAAVVRRDRTGEGGVIDVSQLNATVAMLGPFLLDHDLTGSVPARNGNRGLDAHLQGAFPCRGVDRWVAVTVTDEQERRALSRLIGADPERSAETDTLEDALATWTALRSADEAATRLQSSGIAAYPVHDVETLLLDPQTRDRGWFQAKAGSCFERTLFSDNPLKLTGTPGHTDRAGTFLGSDTVSVLSTLAGYRQEEIDGMVERGSAFIPAQPDLRMRRRYDDYLDLVLGPKGATG